MVGLEYAVLQLVETLRCKRGGRGFDGFIGIFHLISLSSQGIRDIWWA